MKTLARNLLTLIMIFHPQYDAVAAEPSMGFGGVGLGFNSVGQGIGGGFAYGLNGAYFFNDSWGGGAYVRSSNHDQGITLFAFGLEGIFRKEDLVPNLTLGAQLGATKFSGDGTDGNFHLAAGFKATYDYRLRTDMPISVGLDTGIQWTKPENDMVAVFNALGTAKIWF